MTDIKHPIQVSSEAIAFRTDPVLFDRLTTLIRELRTNIPVLGKTIQKDIATAIADVTDIKTNINIESKDYLDAYVYFPCGGLIGCQDHFNGGGRPCKTGAPLVSATDELV